MIDNFSLKELTHKTNISKIRAPFEEKIQALELRSFEKYGEIGEDVALDLLTENPELSNDEQEFWIKLEAEIGQQIQIEDSNCYLN